MKNKELISRVTQMAEPLCAEAGLSLWDVTFEKEGSGYVLTVYIDRDEGVFIEDCEKISRAVDPQLDAPEFDSLPPYTLSVSSAGLERKLTKPAHFEWAKGKKIELTPYKGEAFVGELVEKTSESIVILQNGEENAIKSADCAVVKLYFE